MELDDREILNAISNTLLRYTKDGMFIITQLSYYKEHFGNIIIKLHSKDNINLTISRDRGFIEGTVEINGIPNYFLLKDILHALDIKDELPESYVGILEASDKIMEIITRNWQLLTHSFGDENREVTLNKISNVIKERLRQWENEREYYRRMKQNHS